MPEQATVFDPLPRNWASLVSKTHPVGGSSQRVTAAYGSPVPLRGNADDVYSSVTSRYVTREVLETSNDNPDDKSSSPGPTTVYDLSLRSDLVQDPRLLLVVDNCLPKEQCTLLKSLAIGSGFEAALIGPGTVATDLRNSGRCLLFSPRIAREWREALRPVLPETVRDAYGGEWRLEGVSARLSFLRYEYPDQRFTPHSDGVVRWTEEVDQSGSASEVPKPKEGMKRVKKTQSYFTIQLYLNDLVEGETDNLLCGPPGEQEQQHRIFDCKSGGCTRFFSDASVIRDPEAQEQRDTLVAAICVPKQGRLALFDHRWVHEGQELKQEGLVKYTVRSDVLYTQELEMPEDSPMGARRVPEVLPDRSEDSRRENQRIAHGPVLRKLSETGVVKAGKDSTSGADNDYDVLHHSHTRRELDGKVREICGLRVKTVFQQDTSSGQGRPTPADCRRRRLKVLAVLAGVLWVLFRAWDARHSGGSAESIERDFMGDDQLDDIRERVQEL